MQRFPKAPRSLSARARLFCGTAFRWYREAFGYTTNLVAQAAVAATPFVLLEDVDGIWTHLLVQFNDHVTPVADKAAVFVAFLQHTRTYHWAANAFLIAFAVDGICLTIGFIRFIRWCRGLSAESPPSPQS